MASASEKIDIALEIGKKRIFASAIEWPGWARSGRDEVAALQALCDYGSRYQSVLQEAHLEFQTPEDTSTFSVIERLEGNTTTDFGAPGIPPSADQEPIDEAELRRFQVLLEACWRAFDSAVQSAAGKELRKGPRGGGRDLDKIVQHVINADGSYLGKVGWKREKPEGLTQDEQLERTRQAILDALVASAHGELPARGPRGGLHWTARYFVRRVAWHVLDHAWEIEDRITA